MSKREYDVLTMQFCIVRILMRAWKKSASEIADILERYEILPYIDVCYEYYNSMGEQGVVEDIEEFIAIRGGMI